MPARSPFCSRLSVAILSATILSSPAAFAASYTWDADGDPATGAPAMTTAGSGIWSTSSALWNLGSSAAVDAVWPSGSNSAVFAGDDGTYSITLGTTPMSVDNIAFNSNGYTLRADVPSTLTSASTTVSNLTVALGKTGTIGSGVTFQAGSGTQLNIAGLGTLVIDNGGKVQSTSTSVTLFAGSIGSNAGSAVGTTVEVKTGGTLATVGAFAANGALKVTGGNVVVGTGSVIAIGNFSGTLPNAVFTIDSGTVTAGTFATPNTAGVRFGASGTGNTSHGGVLNLNGGTLTTSRIFEAAGVNASSTVNFNGGTLRASVTNNSDFLSSSIDTAVVKAGGAVIDTNSFNAMIAESLMHDDGVTTDGGLSKSGAGTLTIGAATTNTYNGTTNVSAGTLLVSGSLSGTTAVNVSGGTFELGASERVNDSANLLMSGGVFSTAGFAESLGSFKLSGNATIDLGNGASLFTLAQSTAQTWTGTLSITNWSGLAAGGGADQIFFGTSSAGLTPAQLGLISFVNPEGFDPGTYGAKILPSGEIVAIPEPVSVLSLAGGMGILLGFRRSRRSGIV